MHAPGAPVALWTVTCAGSDGVHIWEHHCLLLLQKQMGQHAGIACTCMKRLTQMYKTNRILTKQ